MLQDKVIKELVCDGCGEVKDLCSNVYSVTSHLSWGKLMNKDFCNSCYTAILYDLVARYVNITDEEFAEIIESKYPMKFIAPPGMTLC